MLNADERVLLECSVFFPQQTNPRWGFNWGDGFNQSEGWKLQVIWLKFTNQQKQKQNTFIKSSFASAIQYVCESVPNDLKQQTR